VSWERSFDAGGQGVAALNRKVIDIAQRNINSGFDLAKSLAGAKNLAEWLELQAAYWRKQLGALTAQAEEFRSLSTKVAADAAAPMKSTWGARVMHWDQQRQPLGQQRDYGDKTRIDMNQSNQVAYWKERFGVLGRKNSVKRCCAEWLPWQERLEAVT
jgi:hypothetical protein